MSGNPINISISIGYYPGNIVAAGGVTLPSIYLRPGGVFTYFRPDGVSAYLRP